MNKTLWILKPQKILINILGVFELSGVGPGYECAANNYHLIISSLTVTYRGSDRGSNQQSNAMDHNYAEKWEGDLLSLEIYQSVASANRIYPF